MKRNSKSEFEIELELDSRRNIYEFIKANPGTHMREIQRRLEMPIGLLKFHIQYLIKHEIITEKVDRYYKRYYLAGTVGSVGREVLSVLRQQYPRWIILHLLENPKAKHKELIKKFDLKPSTLSFYLKNLIDKNIVDRKRTGRESSYTLSDPEKVVQILITYRPSFIDQLVDRFLETWFNEYYGRGEQENIEDEEDQ